MKRSCAIASFIFILLSCGGQEASEAPVFTYALERENTGHSENAVIMQFDDSLNYQIRLEGDGFTSDVALGEFVEMQERIALAYQTEGAYSLTFLVVQHDGTPYLEDTLTWYYSTIVPDAPIVSFSEEATSDAAITIQIADARELETTEIWVEGDLAGAHASGGFWDTLSESGLYPVTVTPDDGLKTVRVKLRNIYGGESAFTEATIEKKSIGPANCTVETKGDFTATTRIQLRLSVSNDGPTYYAIYGDLEEEVGFRAFTSGDVVRTQLSTGVGEKNLTIQIRDAAGSYCPDIEKTITLQNGHKPTSVTIDDDSFWTTDTAQTLTINHDHFPSSGPMEMRITGAVVGGNVWIDYATSAAVTLTASSGDKQIYVRFRDKDLTETFLVSDRVYLNPEVTLVDVGAPFYEVSIAKIVGTSHVTITGCEEVYNQVSYAAVYDCELNAASVDVLYTFTDGTTLSRSGSP